MKNVRKPKKQRINIKPLHPLATFSSTRNPIELTKKFKVSLMDFFVSGVNLTANETKVLIVLRSQAVGRSNLSAIDQELISDITDLQQPNVARAIAGLRKKGMILQTWMEEGSQRYRNIYSLWSPPKQVEQDAKTMLSQRRAAKKLEEKAKNLEQTSISAAEELRKKAQQKQEKICPHCKASAIDWVYLAIEGRNRARWCACSLGIYQARLHNCKWNEFIPDHILKEYLSKLEK
jgi:predicted transcriptional regulator